jgi:hypothetical protein
LLLSTIHFPFKNTSGVFSRNAIASKDGRRATVRSKGKVERPFRTVKEVHENLYHFHEPKDEEEANA